MTTLKFFFPTLSVLALVACGATSGTEGTAEGDRTTDPASESASTEPATKLPPTDGGRGGADATAPKKDAGAEDGGGAADAKAPPPSCSTAYAGNANHACSSDLQSFDAALSSCSGRTPYLTSFVPDESCGEGSSSSLTWECCPTAPTGCSGGALQNAKGYCSASTQLFDSAEADCKAAHGQLVGFELTPCSISPAPAGESGGATYTCCP